jgi:hypothetical protein
MFWWFQRGEEFIRYEARALAKDTYALTVVMPDGTERVELFPDQTALMDRQVALTRELEDDDWSGPFGWNV